MDELTFIRNSHRGSIILCYLVYKNESFFDYVLNDLTTLHEPLHDADMKLSVELKNLRYEQIVWENSDIKWIFSQMIYAFTWDALVVEVCIRFSLFYIQIFLSEFLVRPRYFPRAGVRGCHDLHPVFFRAIMLGN